MFLLNNQQNNKINPLKLNRLKLINIDIHKFLFKRHVL